MTEQKLNPMKVVLINVRASFLSIYEPNVQTQDDGSKRETWKANALIDKDEYKSGEAKAKYMGKVMPVKDALAKASAAAKEKKWGDEKKWPKLKPEKVFVRDGDLEDWEGYPGNYYVSANAPLSDKPACVTNRKNKDGWIPAEPGGAGAPYSGCYINMTIEVWAQDNEHGKRVNAKLKAIQFRADGEAFGAAPTDPNDDFDDDMVGEEGDIGDDDVVGGEEDDGDDDALI
tara:strand:- start:29061 stop:29750 length:690 start_codon:yes stop_codon:yes gene_type:complete